LIRDEFSDLEVHSINVIFDDESNESRVAKKMAESIGSDFHELRVDDPIKHLPKILSIVGEPRWNVYQYYLIEEAKKFSQILFTGDGGDELFGGYTFRYKKFLDRYNESLTWDDKVRIYLECHDRDWVPDQETLFGEKLNFRWENIYELFRKFFDNNMAPLDQVFLADYYGKLMHDFIPTSKKLCDFFGVEGASPLLGNNVIEISRQIPSEEKYDRVRNIGKVPLRHILSRLAGEQIENGKIGFSMNLAHLWHNTAREIITSYLADGRIFRDGLINNEFYSRAITIIKNTNDVRYISKLMQLLSLEIWYRLFITQEIRAESTL
jgi:asparagine synthase (glutamine-hydrolysing)